MVANTRRSLNFGSIMGVVFFAAFLVPGYSLAETGSTQISEEVAKVFEAYRFEPNYDYYFMNLDNSPCAVIGIKKDYAVHDIQWTKIRPDSNEFKKVIELVKRFPMGGSHVFGANILDSQGNTIGVYYSGVTVGVIVNKESKTLSLTMNMGGDRHN